MVCSAFVGFIVEWKRNEPCVLHCTLSGDLVCAYFVSFTHIRRIVHTWTSFFGVDSLHDHVQLVTNTPYFSMSDNILFVDHRIRHLGSFWKAIASTRFTVSRATDMRHLKLLHENGHFYPLVYLFQAWVCVWIRSLSLFCHFSECINANGQNGFFHAFDYMCGQSN